MLILLTNFHFAHAQKTYNYPAAPKDSIVDQYFDTTIYDSYQWMENPDDQRLTDWLDAQAKFSRKINNHNLINYYGISLFEKTKLTEDFVDLENEEEPRFEFRLKWYSDNKIPDLLYRKKGEANFQYLMKMKDFRLDKDDNVWIMDNHVSPDGNIALIRISHSGSDWQEGYFFHLPTKTQLQDTLKNLRSSSTVIWNGYGVLYDHYSPPAKGRELLDIPIGQTLKYHRIGTLQNEDEVIYVNLDKTGRDRFSFYNLDSSHLILNHQMYSRGKTYSAIGYIDLTHKTSMTPKDFILTEGGEINFTARLISNDTVWLSSDWNAPNGKVYFTSVHSMNQLVEFTKEQSSPLISVNLLGRDKIAIVYKDHFDILNHQGEVLKTMNIPKGKALHGLYEYDLNVTHSNFYISSFYHPNLWYQIDLKTLDIKAVAEISVPYRFDRLETRLIEYESYDGTKIPMYITCKKGIKLDSSHSVLIYGYGGYGTTLSPKYDRNKIGFILKGGIYAVPNVRGGGGKGSNWANAGRGLNKGNAIQDFIYAAKYLIKEGYTNPEKIGIMGKSHGGLLVASAAMQQPDLFKAVVAEAGPYDMLRFHKFTIGSTATSINEFGTTDTKEGFTNLYRYSPLHQIQKGTKYPSILLITGDTDDRVPPLHTYKFLATLQENADPTSLIFLNLVKGSGHGGALTIDDYNNHIAITYAFLLKELGL
ncbi:MAG: prolyl oligopeptidase family serine peptidase [Marinoscillum sp.]|uniref:prolyl oligopeptidase family serine peptidase n=1 Tax=Marinoscillum sp. TaxID=2024838 RepID=UPI0032F9AE69